VHEACRVLHQRIRSWEIRAKRASKCLADSPVEDLFAAEVRKEEYLAGNSGADTIAPEQENDADDDFDPPRVLELEFVRVAEEEGERNEENEDVGKDVECERRDVVVAVEEALGCGNISQ
jgi:hypothetical protein